MSTCPPRIMPNDAAESKMLPPGRIVTVCLPALIRSASSSPSKGNGPIPSRPFSLCSVTVRPSGMLLATRVGMPIPRLT